MILGSFDELAAVEHGAGADERDQMDTARQRSWAASMSLNAIWRRRVGVGVGVGADRGTPAAAQLDHFEWMAATSSVAPSIVTTTD